MFQFFEAICLEKDGFRLLDYHQRRVNSVFSRFYPGYSPHNLARCLVPVPRVEGRTKCRFLYDEKSFAVSYEAYVMRTVTRVTMVEAHIHYDVKKTDRSIFENYAKMMAPEEMVVFTEDGYLMDSLFSNVVLFDGKRWITPTTCLLRGVKREYYLETGFITLREVRVSDLPSYTSLGFINAMIDIGELVVPITFVEVKNGLENL